MGNYGNCNEYAYFNYGTWWIDRWVLPSKRNPVRNSAESVGHGKNLAMAVCNQKLVHSRIVRPSNFVTDSASAGTLKRRWSCRAGTWWPSSGTGWTTSKSSWRSTRLAGVRMSCNIQNTKDNKMNDKFSFWSVPWAKDICVAGTVSSSLEEELSQEQDSIIIISSRTNSMGGQEIQPGSSSNTVKDDPGKDTNLLDSNDCFKEAGQPGVNGQGIGAIQGGGHGQQQVCHTLGKGGDCLAQPPVQEENHGAMGGIDWSSESSQEHGGGVEVREQHHVDSGQEHDQAGHLYDGGVDQRRKNLPGTYVMEKG